MLLIIKLIIKLITIAIKFIKQNKKWLANNTNK